MARFNYSFKPTLIPTLAFLVVFPVLLSLGQWQLNRAEEKREIERIESSKDGSSDVSTFLSENLGRIRPSDFDHYGDANIRKGDKGFAIQFLSDGIK